MKRSWSALVALVSLLGVAAAVTRPEYGGTVRVELRANLMSLDPQSAAPDAPSQSALALIAPLIYDNLVRVDDNNIVRPQLATSWQHDPEFKRWTVVLRKDVKFHDGSPLLPSVVADALQNASPDWHVRATSDGVEISSDAPLPHLLQELALPRNVIVRRTPGGTIYGSGPFRVDAFQPGRLVRLTANSSAWSGRPYFDALEIQLGRSLRDQSVDFELDKADVVELAPEQLRRVLPQGRRLALSEPVDLIVLRFDDGDARFRELLAGSVDRTAILSGILQKQGDTAAALLPNWLSGYAMLFDAPADTEHLRALRTGLHLATPVTLSYDTNDVAVRQIAERLALDARQFNLPLRLAGAADSPHAYVERVRLESCDPAVALAGLGLIWQLPELRSTPHVSTPDALYAAERYALRDYNLIPLAHVPEAYGLSQRLHDLSITPDGRLDLASAWMDQP